MLKTFCKNRIRFFLIRYYQIAERRADKARNIAAALELRMAQLHLNKG